jgi:hypothetical protein
MCSLKAPALLAFAKERAEGHGHTSDGMERVPGDTRMRAILEPLSPTWLRPGCKRILRQLQRGKARAERVLLAGSSLFAREGTESFSSTTIPCASC